MCVEEALGHLAFEHSAMCRYAFYILCIVLLNLGHCIRIVHIGRQALR